jgi:hypothetical protein
LPFFDTFIPQYSFSVPHRLSPFETYISLSTMRLYG